MTRRQASAWKLAAIIAAFLIIWALTFLIDSALAFPQPTTRDIEWLLVPDGRVFGGRDEGLILQLGQWSGQILPGNRPIRSRVRAFRVTSAGGEDILFAYLVPPPSRTGAGEPFELAAMEFPGSLWIPISGQAYGQELDGGRIRISVRVFVRQQ